MDKSKQQGAQTARDIVACEALKLLVNESVLFGILDKALYKDLEKRGFISFPKQAKHVRKAEITKKGEEHLIDYYSHNYKLKDMP